ncbi:MAG: VWA domain-containing protein [Bacteroidia bacterium]|nr:VWA domain-containing protein [Bacteroidia bacterium]
MPKYIFSIVFAVALFASISIPANGYKAADKHPLDVVFCLDLSGSTNGLLVDLRNQIWDIINETSTLTPQPNLRIGVVGFSRPSFGKNNYYVKTLIDLTNDFDNVAHSINKIKTSVENGDHNVGAALSHSINKIKWSNNPNALKLLFLVGNGDVRNGSINYASASEDGFNKKNIIINSIFCHPSRSKMEMSGWKRIAELGGGKFFDIHVGTDIPPVYLAGESDKILDLTKSLNRTYIYYGDEGKARYSQMINADLKSRWDSQYVFESRVFYKASSLFQNSNERWDLIDALKANGKTFLSSVDRELLAEDYQELNGEELYDLVMAKKNERNRIVCELKILLNTERQNIINEKLTEKGVQERDHVLQFIVKHVIQEYGADKGFQASN